MEKREAEEPVPESPDIKGASQTKKKSRQVRETTPGEARRWSEKNNQETQRHTAFRNEGK